MAFLPRIEAYLFATSASLSNEPSRRRSVYLYTAILASIRSIARHWASRQLTRLGRVHVAKQVLASKLAHHATFVRPSPQLFKEIGVLFHAVRHPLRHRLRSPWSPAQPLDHFRVV